MKNEKAKVKIIPLGGVNEIGKNLTAIEYKNDIEKVFIYFLNIKFYVNLLINFQNSCIYFV